ncbi:RHS repeat-associated core domain-containing protein [Bordetella bronchialis]|nr:RHS repeat-associated core domain-containing protein [Bordetella bronchialis]
MRDIALRYTGAYRDPVMRGYPLGNAYRWYLPALMRFNKPDDASPFGAAGIHPYTYCAADPVNVTDLSGHIGERLFADLLGKTRQTMARIAGPAAHAMEEAAFRMDAAREDWANRIGAGDVFPVSLSIRLEKNALDDATSLVVRGYSPIGGHGEVPFDIAEMARLGRGGNTLVEGAAITLPPVYVTGTIKDAGTLQIASYPDLLFDVFQGDVRKELLRVRLVIDLVDPDLTYEVDRNEFALAARVPYIKAIHETERAKRTWIETRGPARWSPVGRYSGRPVDLSVDISTLKPRGEQWPPYQRSVAVYPPLPFAGWGSGAT